MLASLSFGSILPHISFFRVASSSLPNCWVVSHPSSSTVTEFSFFCSKVVHTSASGDIAATFLCFGIITSLPVGFTIITLTVLLTSSSTDIDLPMSTPRLLSLFVPSTSTAIGPFALGDFPVLIDLTLAEIILCDPAGMHSSCITSAIESLCHENLSWLSPTDVGMEISDPSSASMFTIRLSKLINAFLFFRSLVPIIIPWLICLKTLQRTVILF